MIGIIYSEFTKLVKIIIYANDKNVLPSLHLLNKSE